MKHVKAVNRKARMVERSPKPGSGDVKALQSPLGCSLIFDPGWETDAAGGVTGLCQPVEADLYGCYDDCWWPAQVPDQLTNYLGWSDSCAAAERDWRKTRSDLPRQMKARSKVRWMRPLGAAALALSFIPLAEAEESEFYVLGVHPHGIVIFDGTRNELAGQIQTRGRAPKELVPSPDGKFVYATTDGRAKLEVVNLETRSVDRLLEITPPGYRLTIYGMVLNNRGDRLYVHVKPVRELMDRYVVDAPQVWAVDVNTGKTQKIAEVPQGVAALALTRDERQLIAWGRDIYYIDVARNRITDTFPLMNQTSPTAGALNTLALFIQFERSGVFSIPYYAKDPITAKDLMGLVNLDLNDGKVNLVELGSPVPLYSAVVSPDRKHAYAVMNQLLAIDLDAKRITQATDLERTRYVANISRDGKRVFVSGAAPFIHVYDSSTLQLMKTIELPGDPSVTAFRALPARSP